MFADGRRRVFTVAEPLTSPSRIQGRIPHEAVCCQDSRCRRSRCRFRRRRRGRRQRRPGRARRLRGARTPSPRRCRRRASPRRCRPPPRRCPGPERGSARAWPPRSPPAPRSSPTARPPRSPACSAACRCRACPPSGLAVNGLPLGVTAPAARPRRTYARRGAPRAQGARPSASRVAGRARHQAVRRPCPLGGQQDPQRQVEQELRAGQQTRDQEDHAHRGRGGAEAPCQRRAHSADHAAVGGAGKCGSWWAPSRTVRREQACPAASSMSSTTLR